MNLMNAAVAIVKDDFPNAEVIDTLPPMPPIKIQTEASFATGYMDNGLFDLGSVIEEAAAALATVEYDTLVGTGFSGACVIPALALHLGKSYLLIRKDEDTSHHGGGRPIGVLGERWLFVDDFISMGRTRERVIQKVEKNAGYYGMAPILVGQYLYANSYRRGFTSATDEAWA